jgi:hypothetical protein
LDLGCFIIVTIVPHHLFILIFNNQDLYDRQEMSSESETVDEVLARDLAALEELSTEQLEGLLRLVIGFLIDSRGSGFQEKLGVYSETHGMGGAALKSMVRASLLFLQRGVRAGWAADQVEEACAAVGLSADCAAVFGRCWAQQSSSLTSTLLSKIVSANQLMDVDWSFGVTAASDDCDQVRGGGGGGESQSLMSQGLLSDRRDKKHLGVFPCSLECMSLPSCH